MSSSFEYRALQLHDIWFVVNAKDSRHSEGASMTAQRSKARTRANQLPDILRLVLP